MPQQGLGGAYLPVLLQVVVQDLRVGLLMRGQDVHEGGGGVGSRRGRVDGAAAAQCRRQVEGGRWGSSVKSLLLEGLLRRRSQQQSKGWEVGSAPPPPASPFPAPRIRGPGGSAGCREQTGSLPRALFSLRPALGWERSGISLLPRWLLRGEETSLPRKAVSELGFCSSAKRHLPAAPTRH